MTTYLEKYVFDMFKDVRNGFFVECGAYDGIHRSVSVLLERKLGWTGINIEPNPEHFSALAGNRPNCENLNLALSDRSSDGREFVVLSNQWNCLRSCLPALGMSEGHVRREFRVRTSTFADLMAERKVGRIDLLALDVEGHEEEVVRGMAGSRILPDFLCVEFNHVRKDRLAADVIALGYGMVAELQYDFVFRRLPQASL